MYGCRDVIIAGFDETAALDIVNEYHIRLKEKIYTKQLMESFVPDNDIARSGELFHYRISENINSMYIPKGRAELIIAKDVVSVIEAIDYLKTDGRVLIKDYPIELTYDESSRNNLRKCKEFIEDININTGLLK